jgi:hypothetical protein
MWSLRVQIAPVLGLGYSAGVSDFDLRRAFSSLILIKVQVCRPCFKHAARQNRTRQYFMTTWIVKFATDDPDRALANLEDQRSKGYAPWIEDGNGAAVDEQSLKMNGRVKTKLIHTERLMGPLFVGTSIFAGLVVLYLVGMWIDH